MMTFDEEWAAASAQMGQREYGRAREHFGAALELATDEAERLSARALLARMDSATGELAAARVAIDAALAEAPADLALRIVARLRQVEAIITREEGAREVATDKFIALYDFCMQAELWDPAIDAAHHVAIAGNLEQQVTWAKKGIAAAEAGDRRGWLAVLWNNLGVTYEDLDQPVDVLEAYEQARRYHYETGGPVQKLAADWAVGRAWRMNGDAAEAQRWIERSLEAARKRYADDPSPAAAEWIAYGLQELAAQHASRMSPRPRSGCSRPRARNGPRPGSSRGPRAPPSSTLSWRSWPRSYRTRFSCITLGQTAFTLKALWPRVMQLNLVR